MDFLRGQLLRREKLLSKQRVAFFQELLILREQVSTNLSLLSFINNKPPQTNPSTTNP